MSYELQVSDTIERHPDTVWSVIGDWGWWAFGPVARDPTDPNTRVLGGGRIVETLVDRDPATYTVRYRMTRSPFNLASYEGEIRLEPSAGRSTKVTYTARYGIAASDELAFRETFSRSLRDGIENLRAATALRGELDFTIEAPLERLWSAVANWHDVSWVMSVERAEVLSETKRRLVFAGERIVENELVSIDEANHTFVYRVTRTPLPLAFYQAVLQLTAVTPDLTRWSYRFEYVPQPGMSAELARTAVEGSLDARRTWLQDKFGTRKYDDPRPQPWREGAYVVRYWYLATVARASKLVWRLFSLLPVAPAADLRDPPSLPQQDPEPSGRAKQLGRFAAALHLRPLYAARGFRTQKSEAVPPGEAFPLWWKASLLAFQGQIRLLLGPSAVVSMAPVRVRTEANLKRIWAWLPDTKYNATSWEDDRTFAELFLASTGATLIRRWTERPGRLLPISLQRLRTVEPRFDDAFAKAHAYVVDFDAMEGLSNELEDVPAPILVFGHDEGQRLRPWLIQLNGVAYTPTDDADWLHAKMWAAKAYIGMVRTVHHGLLSHFSWAGTMSIATLRRLAERHPLHRLLAPFTRYTIEINQLAEKLIVNASGALAGQVMGFEGSVELMRRMDARMSYDDVHLPRDLAARGVLTMPGHYAYRDDGLPIWQAIHRFVGRRLANWYTSPAMITGDPELQLWAYDIARVIRGFPAPIAEMSELTDAVTSAIYSVVLHQLHNAPAADHTIVPGRAASLASTVRGVRLPRFRGDGPPELWKHAALGNVVITLLFDSTLTAYNKRLTLAHGLEQYCTSADEVAAVRDFFAACETISRNIQEANARGQRPLRFDHLDPVLICSQSVSS